MLMKLLKHEFRATARIMGPLYLVLLAAALAANLTAGLLDADSFILNIVAALIVMAWFVAAIIGVFIVAFILMLQRFYKNLLGDEGYHDVHPARLRPPARVEQADRLRRVVHRSPAWWWSCRCWWLAFNVSFLTDLAEVFPKLFEQLNAYYAFNGTAFMLEGLVLLLAGCMTFSLQFYAALAVGHSFPNHKMALSVVFFFVFQFAMQILGAFLILALDEGPAVPPADEAGLPHRRRGRGPLRHVDAHRPDGALRRGVLLCNRFDIEKAPEPGVNWGKRFRGRGKLPRPRNFYGGGRMPVEEDLMRAVLLTFGTAMVPVLELRGAIPVGVAAGLSPAAACAVSVLGNMVPVPFILLLIRRIFDWLRGTRLFGPKIDWLERRAHLKGRVVRKYRLPGLIILVAIPLPGTGAWTGALVAALLDIRMRHAVPAIFLGVVIAGAIVTTVTYGVVNLI